MTQADLFPPGEFIRDELEARNWTQEDLAEVLGRPLRTVNRIIAGKIAITSQTAQELAAAFGTSAELWLNLENAYRLSLERVEQSDVVKRSRLFELAPVKDLLKRRWIPEVHTADEMESVVLKFLEIESITQVPSLGHAARKATSYESVTPAQLAWCFRAKHLAKAMTVSRFSASILRDSLQALRSLSATESSARKVPELLRDLGIRFLVIEHLPRSRIDGATLWLDEESPVIVVSMRYDRIDGFWHTLAHELFHVLNGDGSIDMDLVGTHCKDAIEKPEVESRADEFASDFLVPRDMLEAFMQRHRPRFSKSNIVGFSEQLGVHPGIVVGQLHFRKAIQYSHSREMLSPIRETLTSAAITDGWGAVIFD